MKTAFFVAVILCSAAAFGQAGSLSNQVAPLHMADHPQHASFSSMASEHSLVGGSSDSYTYAQGERPLWEFGDLHSPSILGGHGRCAEEGRGMGTQA